MFMTLTFLNLCCRRAKLFVYGETMLDKGTGNKTWREKGVGDVKFLRYCIYHLQFLLYILILTNISCFILYFRHKENNRIRVLMRQEKTMKVIVNHFLDPRIVLTPNVGNDKSWVWVAFDFSDEELVETVSYHVFLYFILF